MFIR